MEDCVNKVGVDLNTASASLLEYISGISKVIAKNIVAYREENGRFTSRKELLKVAKLGPKAFEQCAGFMRISGGSEPAGCHQCSSGILRSGPQAAWEDGLYIKGYRQQRLKRPWPKGRGL